jgi:hypothetical protein
VTSYRIDTLSDMLAVPANRRAAMFRDLEYALSLHDFALGEYESEGLVGFTWNDDGNHSVVLADETGNPVLTFAVTNAADTVGPALLAQMEGEG